MTHRKFCCKEDLIDRLFVWVSYITLSIWKANYSPINNKMSVNTLLCHAASGPAIVNYFVFLGWVKLAANNPVQM